MARGLIGFSSPEIPAHPPHARQSSGASGAVLTVHTRLEASAEMHFEDWLGGQPLRFQIFAQTKFFQSSSTSACIAQIEAPNRLASCSK
jgi:hypothetical protein